MKNPLSLDAPDTVFVPCMIVAVLAFSLLLAYLLLTIPLLFVGLAILVAVGFVLRVVHYVFFSN